MSWRSQGVQEKYRIPRCVSSMIASITAINVVTSPVDTVGSHRTPNNSTHFEYTQKKTLSLCVLIRAQWGHRKVTIAAQLGLLQYNRSWIHGCAQGSLYKCCGLPWRLQGDCITFFGISLRLQHAISTVQTWSKCSACIVSAVKSQ